jgi:hypothetical protein
MNILDGIWGLARMQVGKPQFGDDGMWHQETRFFEGASIDAPSSVCWLSPSFMFAARAATIARCDTGALGPAGLAVTGFGG